MAHEIFVSHSSKDQSSANALVAHLERNGIRCWAAPRDLVPGANMACSLVKAIAGSKLMVLIFSNHANAASHLCLLVERAVHVGIPLISLRIEDVQPSEALERLLSSSHRVDAITQPLEQHLPGLTDTIRARLYPAATALVKTEENSPPLVDEEPAAPSSAAPVKSPFQSHSSVVSHPCGTAALGSDSAFPQPRAAVPHGSENACKPASAPIVTASRGSNHHWLWISGAAVVAASIVLGLIVSKRRIPSPAADSRVAPATPIALGTPAFLSSSASRDQRLELLQQLLQTKQLSADQVALATQLLNTPSSMLSQFDSARLVEFAKVLEGRAACAQLGRAVAAIDASEQQQRLAHEEAARVETARQAQINSLLATARANDNEDRDTIALAALNELLQLEPSNAAALQLHDKISQYGPAKQRRIEQEAAVKAAAERKAKLNALLATAAAEDKSGHGGDGLALLDELLKLEPQYAQALSLRETISNELKVTNSLGMTLMYIPAGTFLMGSPPDEPGRLEEEIQHTVVLTRSFFMAATPVTQAQWEAIMESRPSNFQGDNLPVEQVSYDDAVKFCRKLSIKENKHYRLPTEAEWEYACRAGATTPYNTGTDEHALSEFGWYDGNSAGTTHPVGQKKPNAWGLRDMRGNVWQWCADWYGAYGNGQAIDPHGADAVRDRVLRGGSWHDPADRCRAARRRYSAPDARYYSFGFRVVLDPG